VKLPAYQGKATTSICSLPTSRTRHLVRLVHRLMSMARVLLQRVGAGRLHNLWRGCLGATQPTTEHAARVGSHPCRQVLGTVPVEEDGPFPCPGPHSPPASSPGRSRTSRPDHAQSHLPPAWRAIELCRLPRGGAPVRIQSTGASARAFGHDAGAGRGRAIEFPAPCPACGRPALRALSQRRGPERQRRERYSNRGTPERVFRFLQCAGVIS